MAFTFDPTTDRGKVRLLVSDTDASLAKNQVFTDTEIDALLALESQDVYAAAAAACRAIASSRAKSAIIWEALETKLDMKEVPKVFRDLAADYLSRAIDGAVVEEIDSFAHRIDAFGRDLSEYVGETI